MDSVMGRVDQPYVRPRSRAMATAWRRLRADGSPRVHPVTPIIGEQLFLFMEPTSPKGKDFKRDPRYTLHCSDEDSSGGEGEFYLRGRALLTSDPLLRAQAVQAASYAPQDRYMMFTLTLVLDNSNSLQRCFVV